MKRGCSQAKARQGEESRHRSMISHAQRRYRRHRGYSYLHPPFHTGLTPYVSDHCHALGLWCSYVPRNCPYFSNRRCEQKCCLPQYGRQRHWLRIGYDKDGNNDILNDWWRWDGSNWDWVSGSTSSRKRAPRVRPCRCMYNRNLSITSSKRPTVMAPRT